MGELAGGAAQPGDSPALESDERETVEVPGRCDEAVGWIGERWVSRALEEGGRGGCSITSIGVSLLAPR